MKDDLRVPAAGISQLGPRRRRQPRLPVALATGVAVVVVVACTVWSRQRPLPPPTAQANYPWHFSDPRDMVATSDLVVLATVTGVERGRVSDQGDVVKTTRLLHARVDEHLFGTPPVGFMTVEDLGWERSGGREVPWRDPRMIRLEVGDRAVLFLHGAATAGQLGLLDDQAGYRVVGADIADTDRTDPVVRRIEAMSVSELEQLVHEAAAAVRRGELEPVPEGGRRPGQRP